MDGDKLDQDLYLVDVGSYWWVTYDASKLDAKQTVIESLEGVAADDLQEAIEIVANVEPVTKTWAMFCEVIPYDDTNLKELWEDMKEDYSYGEVICQSHRWPEELSNEDE